jgi:regulator of sigma E protease
MEVVLIKIAQVVAAFSLLIVLHEGGHFLFAKLFKIRVEKFYLFFDFPIMTPRPQFAFFTYRQGKFSFLKYTKITIPKKSDDTDANNASNEPDYKASAFSVLSWNKGKLEVCKWEHDLEKIAEEESKQPTYATEYGIGWLPLGGYVNISGMIDESKQQLSVEPKPWEFRTKPAWQRLLVMLGGIIVNFITAFVIYMAVLFTWGESYVKPTDITNGMKFSETAKADGFTDGDIVIKTDGKDVKTWSINVLRDISNSKEVTVLRQNEEVTIKMPEKMNMLEMAQSNPPYMDILIPFNIDSIIPGSPAETAGLKVGDVITELNGEKLSDFNDLVYRLADLKGSLTENSTAADSLKTRSITLVVNGKDTLKAVLTHEFTLGFSNPAPQYNTTTKEYGLLECIPAGIASGWDKLCNYVNDLKYLFSAQGAKSVSGVIGITNIFPETWDWQRFWLLTALLSIALGVMNVLPIPALDGGHAVFAIYEMVTRRKPSDKVLEKAQYIGFAILIGLLILATWNDITRLLGL